MKEFEEIIEIILNTKKEVKYQLKYTDYSDGMWTAPSILTINRFDHFKNDLSVNKLKIILEDGEVILQI